MMSTQEAQKNAFRITGERRKVMAFCITALRARMGRISLWP